MYIFLCAYWYWVGHGLVHHETGTIMPCSMEVLALIPRVGEQFKLFFTDSQCGTQTIVTSPSTSAGPGTVVVTGSYAGSVVNTGLYAGSVVITGLYASTSTVVIPVLCHAWIT